MKTTKKEVAMKATVKKEVAMKATKKPTKRWYQERVAWLRDWAYRAVAFATRQSTKEMLWVVMDGGWVPELYDHIIGGHGGMDRLDPEGVQERINFFKEGNKGCREGSNLWLELVCIGDFYLGKDEDGRKDWENNYYDLFYVWGPKIVSHKARKYRKSFLIETANGWLHDAKVWSKVIYCWTKNNKRKEEMYNLLPRDYIR